MVGITSAGLFGNLGANQGKLNTKKGKTFLWNGGVRRMQGTDYRVHEKGYSASKLQRLRKRLKTEATLENQKRILILINSALIVSMILMMLA